jgi:hypothetical protein
MAGDRLARPPGCFLGCLQSAGLGEDEWPVTDRSINKFLENISLIIENDITRSKKPHPCQCVGSAVVLLLQVPLTHLDGEQRSGGAMRTAQWQLDLSTHLAGHDADGHGHRHRSQASPRLRDVGPAWAIACAHDSAVAWQRVLSQAAIHLGAAPDALPPPVIAEAIRLGAGVGMPAGRWHRIRCQTPALPHARRVR